MAELDKSVRANMVLAAKRSLRRGERRISGGLTRRPRRP